MITVTLQECLNADRALQQLADEPWPLKFAVRVALIRAAVLAKLQPLQEAHTARVRAAATVGPDNEPIVLQSGAGLVYEIAPAKQLQLQQEYDDAARVVVDLDIAPLALADFPEQLRGLDTILAPSVLVALGPLFVS